MFPKPIATLMAATLVVMAGIATVKSDTQCGCKFGENIQSAVASQQCKDTVAQIGYVSPALKQCYRSSGLYFSTPDAVCSPNCLDATIKAAGKVADACPLASEEAKTSPANVYNAWSNKGAAEAVCAKNTQGKYCLEAFAAMLVPANTISLYSDDPQLLAGLDRSTPDWRTVFDCDGPCSRPVYDALKGNGTNAPILYFFGYDNLDPLFKAFEQKCGFQPQTPSGTENATSSTPSDVSNGDTEATTTPTPSAY